MLPKYFSPEQFLLTCAKYFFLLTSINTSKTMTYRAINSYCKIIKKLNATWKKTSYQNNGEVIQVKTHAELQE